MSEDVDAASKLLSGPPLPKHKPSNKRKKGEVTDETSGTLVITHAQCTQHKTHKGCPERPQRVHSVMEELQKVMDEHEDQEAPPFAVLDMQTSPAMLQQLQAQLRSLVGGSGTSATAVPPLQRTKSVAYLEGFVLPAVRAVHNSQTQVPHRFN